MAFVYWGLWLAHILMENENVLSGTEKNVEESKAVQKTKALPKQ